MWQRSFTFGRVAKLSICHLKYLIKNKSFIFSKFVQSQTYNRQTTIKSATCRNTMPLDGVKLSWDFKFSPEELLERTDKLLLEGKKVYDVVGSLQEKDISFENVLKPLADVECDMYTESYQYSFVQHVSTNKALRDASCKAEKKLNEFEVEISMRQDLFEKLQALEMKQLAMSPEADRYLKKLLEKRQRNGLHLSEDIQKEIKELKNSINNFSTEFVKNLNEDTSSLEFTDEELIGLPKDFIENLPICPDSGKRKVTMKYPDYVPIMKNAKQPETRRLMYFAFNSRCAKENVPILEEVLQLRHKLATLLGFSTFADYNTKILMSKSANNVSTFLTDLAKKLIPLWDNERNYMLELKEKECKEMDIPFDGLLNNWDMSYYTSKVEEIKYAIDQNKLQEYFPLHVVTAGLLKIYQILLGVTFQEVEDVDVWHPDVKAYKVSDTKTGQLLGYFFLDLFPREGKFSHAAMCEMQPGCLLSSGTRQIGVVAVLANFTKQTSEKPSLLTHEEVTTFFHEFGHVMHFLCAQADYVYFSGTRVETDFLEAPSQMLENWCWVSDTLRMMSSHYKDQSELPQDLIDKLATSRLANTGYLNLRQIALATFDQRIHTCEKSDTKTVYAEVMEELLNLKPTEGTHFAANFMHMLNGYEAGYYSYMWSEVFSIDMFETCFGKDNVLSPDVGMRYRTKILQPGGTKDAADILKDFLGREPNQNAFLISKGLPV